MVTYCDRGPAGARVRTEMDVGESMANALCANSLLIEAIPRLEGHGVQSVCRQAALSDGFSVPECVHSASRGYRDTTGRGQQCRYGCRCSAWACVGGCYQPDRNQASLCDRRSRGRAVVSSYGVGQQLGYRPHGNHDLVVWVDSVRPQLRNSLWEFPFEQGPGNCDGLL